MGYTSGVAMDQRGLAMLRRWRDKIEVTPRQPPSLLLVFWQARWWLVCFSFWASWWASDWNRGGRAVAPEVEDPLALLGQGCHRAPGPPRPPPSPSADPFRGQEHPEWGEEDRPETGRAQAGGFEQERTRQDYRGWQADR